MEGDQKNRKGSFADSEFTSALLMTQSVILTILAMIPKDTDYMVCFSSSLVLQACDPNSSFHKECSAYLMWRFTVRGLITNDLDLIFKNDPAEDLARLFRHWNRDETKFLTIDWWASSHYQGDWEWVKTQGLRNREFINGIPVQTFREVVRVKKELLSGDPKHLEDTEFLENV